MSPARNPGRVVGFWYLLSYWAARLRLIYIPNKLFVHGDGGRHGRQHRAHQMGFSIRNVERDLFGAVVLIFSCSPFYRLFKVVRPAARPCSS